MLNQISCEFSVGLLQGRDSVWHTACHQEMATQRRGGGKEDDNI